MYIDMYVTKEELMPKVGDCIIKLQTDDNGREFVAWLKLLLDDLVEIHNGNRKILPSRKEGHYYDILIENGILQLKDMTAWMITGPKFIEFYSFILYSYDQLKFYHPDLTIRPEINFESEE